MASPQKENGNTGISNELFDKVLELPLTGSEFKILFFVFRRTYGWNKKEDLISISQFQKNLKLSRQTVVNGLGYLVKSNILVKKLDQYITSYGPQKDYDEWVVNPNRLVKSTSTTSQTKCTKTSQARLTHKKKKNSIQKTTRQQSCPEANEIIKFYKDTYDFKKTIPKQLENWRAAKWLYEQYGVERTCQAILAAKSALEDSISGTDKVPLIKNLMDLKEKYDQLRAYYGRKKSRQSSIVEI